ncbi:facilitated trehalose transporter Tret1-like [Phymastichus coffea]|uniref:facilitated trehalose transporter Tret1-like n=1 Tax=Phymastichus coffea TaxID=108790 RepID=UPI00273BB418|nr:facilitated trehalose transporter Tret1-like [Phymastichus coffea]
MANAGGSKDRRVFGQCLASAGATILITQTGIMGGWTSPNMARLTGENATIPLSLEEASWVASCLNLGRFVSVVLVPMLIDLAGSKRTILLSFVPVSVGWITMMLANSALWLCVARFLSGITYGLAYGCFSIYLAEVSVATLRGTFISVAMIGWPMGTLLGTIAETYLPMSVSSGLYLAQCLLGMALLAWLPESPQHLVRAKDSEGARKAFGWYRGGIEAEVDAELSAIAKIVESSAQMDGGLASRVQRLASGRVRKSLLLVVALFSLQQMCGLFDVEFYMETILTKARLFLIEPREAVIWANLVLLVATVISVNLLDKLGRRPLLVASSLGVALAMAGLGLHFQLFGRSDVEAGSVPQWLPLASIALFTVTFTAGFMSVPSTVLSEIFPADLKGSAACVCSLTSALFGFLASKSYLPTVEAVGEAYVFWAHAALSALAAPVALFLMPETRGKSLQEIQASL